MPIEHFVARVTSKQTHTGDLTFTDIPGASISGFSVGDVYLLLLSATVDSSGASHRYEYRLVHGSTLFDGTEIRHVQSGQNRPWHALVVWTAASETVKAQFRCATNTGTTVGCDNLVLIALNLNDLQVNDYVYNEVSVDTGLTQTFSTTNNPTITFTPDASGDWLVMCSQTLDMDTNLRACDARIRQSDTGGELSTIPACRYGNQGIDRWEDGFLARIYTLVGGTEYTFEGQAASVGADNHDRRHGTIIAIRLAAFAHAVSSWSAGPTSLSASSFGTNLATHSFTPPVMRNYFVIGGFVADIQNASRTIRRRVQVDDTDDLPDTETSDAYAHAESAADTERPHFRMDVIELDPTSHTVDLDASADDTTGTPEADDILLAAMSLELFSETPAMMGMMG